LGAVSKGPADGQTISDRQKWTLFWLGSYWTRI
jgi:hypothetical protein